LNSGASIWIPLWFISSEKNFFITSWQVGGGYLYTSTYIDRSLTCERKLFGMSQIEEDITYCFWYRYLLFKWQRYSLPSIIHFRKFHRHQCTLQLVWGQHIGMFGICEDVRHFPQPSYSATVNSHNGQLTLHTDSHASDSGAVRRERRTILGTKSKLLYSEIALSRKPFGIGHMYIYTFLLSMTDTMTSQNVDVSSWDSLYACYNTLLINIWSIYRQVIPLIFSFLCSCGMKLVWNIKNYRLYSLTVSSSAFVTLYVISTSWWSCSDWNMWDYIWKEVYNDSS
jgi:hypothetical protein